MLPDRKHQVQASRRLRGFIRAYASGFSIFCSKLRDSSNTQSSGSEMCSLNFMMSRGSKIDGLDFEDFKLPDFGRHFGLDIKTSLSQVTKMLLPGTDV